MIIFIDQSRYWRGHRAGTLEWIWLLETFFQRRPERRPASRLEVFLLSRALDCPEEPIERHRSGRLHTIPKHYTPTTPA